MLPEVVWNMPRMGTFNLHGSLLPQYRGAAPLNWAVINGETNTGVTTFLLDHEIDTGKIIFKEETPIGENETVGDVHDRLMEIGAKLVVKTVDSIAEGNIQLIPQTELIEGTEINTLLKFSRKIAKLTGKKILDQIRNLIRGLSPYPAAWANLVHEQTGTEIMTKLFFAQKTESIKHVSPGTIETDRKSFMNVACKNGWLQITDLQIAGKKRMKVDEFLRGFQQIGDCRFD
jgi:methionyl-tRNA formyltransferase